MGDGVHRIYSIDWLAHNLAENGKDAPTLNGIAMFSNVEWLRDVGVPHDVDEKREALAKDSVLFVQLPMLRTVGQAGAWGNVTRSIPEVTDWLVIHVAEAHAVVVVFWMLPCNWSC